MSDEELGRRFRRFSVGLVPGIGYRMPGAGCWEPGAGCPVLGSVRRVLGVVGCRSILQLLVPGQGVEEAPEVAAAAAPATSLAVAARSLPAVSFSGTSAEAAWMSALFSARVAKTPVAHSWLVN
mgnify:CR=1 FL=1